MVLCVGLALETRGARVRREVDRVPWPVFLIGGGGLEAGAARVVVVVVVDEEEAICDLVTPSIVVIFILGIILCDPRDSRTCTGIVSMETSKKGAYQTFNTS